MKIGYALTGSFCTVSEAIKALRAVAKNNDQLLVFMLFAMLSNAGFYMISGVGAQYFDVVVGDGTKQSSFGTLGAVGSILGLAVIPVMMKFTTRRRTYQCSLLIAITGYVGMFLAAKVADSLTLLNIANLNYIKFKITFFIAFGQIIRFH